MINRYKQKISNFFLYGIIFSITAFISSLFTDGEYTITPPIAHADIPYSSFDSGDSADGGGAGGSGGDSCDSADGAGDSCD